MVQRKLPDKIGIRADHIKANNKPIPSLLKPSSTTSQQHQDVMKISRGADLKKKMMKKKSGKGKHSEFENLRSPSMRMHVSPPGKSPAAPEQSSPVRASSNSTPNYMKSTSSSDARKGKSTQVSPQSVSSNCKNSRRKQANISKPELETLARTSSLKLVRALTKAPNFKPTRVSSKKCSQVVLQVQRDTCSSTLKDSKFPCYLELAPGGTESQGTSAMKVCPYTYCSLNGHHHLQFPPLKSFLSAKRRSLKAQRSLKIGCLSPRRARPSSLSLAGNDAEQQQEEVSLLGPEENMDFTVDIYCKEMTGMSGGSTEAVKNHCPANSPPTDPEPTDSFDDSSAQEGNDILPEESVSEFLSEDHCFENSDSQDSDMDWEGPEYSDFYIDVGFVDSLNHNEEPHLELYCLDKKVCEVVQDESALNAEEITSCRCDETLAENILQESFDQESMTCGAWLSDEDEENIILQEDNVSAVKEYDQESKDSHDFVDSENNTIADEKILPQLLEGTRREQGCSRLPIEGQNNGSESEEEGRRDEEPETNEVGSQNLPVNNSEQELYTSEKESEKWIEGQNNGSESEEEGRRDEEPETNQVGSQNLPVNDSEQELYTSEKESEKWNANLEVVRLRRAGRHNRLIQEDEQREFNPRGPNFLPLETDPEAEKVNLKHQMIDERKNAEEWMIDYALRQAVSKLAPARRKRVALLVEAFETVSPIPKCEPHLRQNTKLFSPRTYIQACS